jgi:MFS transporter, OFA family, oxalate/formate antiporter
MGAGLSPLFWSPLIESLIGTKLRSLPQTIPLAFFAMASIFIIDIIVPAQLMRVPPPGWKPAGWTAAVNRGIRCDIPASRMLRTWQFYALWASFVLGVAVGLTAIGQASPLIREVSGTLTPFSPGVAIGLMGVCNAAGRLSWGTLSDRVGRRPALFAMSCVSMIACVGLLRNPGGFWGAVAGLCLAAFAYGGFLALMPAMSADYYGQSNVGGNYGFLFLAWGVCGFVVPGYIESTLDHARTVGDLAGGYRHVYSELALLAAIVAILTLVLRPPQTMTLIDGDPIAGSS